MGPAGRQAGTVYPVGLCWSHFALSSVVKCSGFKGENWEEHPAVRAGAHSVLSLVEIVTDRSSHGV